MGNRKVDKKETEVSNLKEGTVLPLSDEAIKTIKKAYNWANERKK